MLCSMKALQRYLEDTATTQTELARQIGVSQPTVWEWLNGHTSPSADNLVRLSGITGISIDKLLKDRSL